MRNFIIAAAAALTACVSAAYAVPPIEAYGELPEIRELDISPDGSRFAFFRRQGDKEILVVFEAGQPIATLDVTDVKPRSVWFQTNDYLFVVASQTTKQWGGYENGQVFVFDVKTKKAEPLAGKERSFRFYRDGAGEYIFQTDKPNEVFFSAWVGEKGDYPTNELLRANLDTGRASRVIKGSTNTTDWIVTPDGVVLAREDFDDRGNVYQLYTRRNGSWKLLHEEKADLQPMSLVGYMPDMSGLIVHVSSDDQGVDQYKIVSFDGEISNFRYQGREANPNFIMTDKFRKMIGIGTSGLRTKYEYLDPQLTETMNAIKAQYPNDEVWITDRTDDWSQLVVSIEGGATAPAYFLVNRLTGGFGKLAPQYLRINDADIAPVALIEYAARDGLKIPAVLTHPKGAGAGSMLPLVVIPHGGPVAYDSLGFDYWAQFFASRGYVVLQPNFRGSAGFGASFRRAGYGEWGAKMQDDVTDGVNYLIEKGWADPDRACIIGGSYGGYAALAGGAFTPDLYKCVVAIAPVTDIPSFLEHRARTTGRYSSTSDYWRMVIGDRWDDREKLEAISPARRANKFKAPVLLIHGTDDTVVPYSQSAKMEEELRSFAKNVKLVKLKAEDHWLSSSPTRLQTFIEMDRFVNEHIGPAN